MNRNEQHFKNDGSNQFPYGVGATDMFTASDYLASNSMDNVEGMMKLLMNNPYNIVKRGSENLAALKTIAQPSAAGRKKIQKASLIRAFSAETLAKPRRGSVMNFREISKDSVIKPDKIISDPSTPHAFVIGPVRIQTVQKISGRLAGKFYIDELIELFGCGMKHPSKELITIKPKIIESRPTATKFTPKTIQSVKIGHNYIQIERKTELQVPESNTNGISSTKELVEFDGNTNEPKKESSWRQKSKSDSALLATPIFNLIGPLVVTADQSTVRDISGGYKIFEEIELRASGSTAKPETMVTPFLRKVSESPVHGRHEMPLKYQENVLVGHNVMLIKRLVEIRPASKSQKVLLNEERNYVTDKTAYTPPTTSTPPKSIAATGTRKSSKFDSLDLHTASSTESVDDIFGEIEKSIRPLALSIDSKDLTGDMTQPSNIVETIKREQKSISPTEAFINADLSTAKQAKFSASFKAKSIIDEKKQKSTRREIEQLPEAVWLRSSESQKRHKRQSKTPTEAFMGADLLTARKVSSYILSSSQPSITDPPTPPRTPRGKTKRKHRVKSKDGDIHTAAGLSSSYSESSVNSDSYDEQSKESTSNQSSLSSDILLDKKSSHSGHTSLNGKGSHLFGSLRRKPMKESQKKSSTTSSTSSPEAISRAMRSRFYRFSNQKEFDETSGKDTVTLEDLLQKAFLSYGTRRRISPSMLEKYRSRFKRFPQKTTKATVTDSKKGSTIPGSKILTSQKSTVLNNRQKLDGLPQKTQISADVKSSDERSVEKLSPVTAPLPPATTMHQSKLLEFEKSSQPELTKTGFSPMRKVRTKASVFPQELASKFDKTTVLIQSKGENNLTMEMSINFKVKRSSNTPNEKHDIKPKRILIGNREVFNDNDTYQL